MISTLEYFNVHFPTFLLFPKLLCSFKLFRNFDYAEPTWHSEKLKFIWFFAHFFVTLRLCKREVTPSRQKKE